MLLEPSFAVTENAEAQRWDRHYAELNYDEAVRERAEELSAQYPDTVEEFAREHPLLMAMLSTDEAQDEYAEFVDRLCLKLAEAEWKQ